MLTKKTNKVKMPSISDLMKKINELTEQLTGLTVRVVEREEKVDKLTKELVNERKDAKETMKKLREELEVRFEDERKKTKVMMEAMEKELDEMKSKLSNQGEGGCG